MRSIELLGLITQGHQEPVSYKCRLNSKLCLGYTSAGVKS